MPPDTDTRAYLGGFTAAEGYFGRTSDAFAFRVAVGSKDIGMCELLRETLGVGRVYAYPPRREGYEGSAVFGVRSHPDLVNVVVPFMDKFLIESYKRQQFMVWRAALLDFWEHRAKRRRPCTMDGCDLPRRARGLCRRHYYLAYYG